MAEEAEKQFPPMPNEGMMKSEEELEILHPRYSDAVKQLRDIADKIESGEYGMFGFYQERKVRGRKNRVFSGRVELRIGYYVSALDGEIAE